MFFSFCYYFSIRTFVNFCFLRFIERGVYEGFTFFRIFFRFYLVFDNLYLGGERVVRCLDVKGYIVRWFNFFIG